MARSLARRGQIARHRKPEGMVKTRAASLAAGCYLALIRINPDNPSSTTDFVCDLCTEIPKPTDGGKTYTFKIRDGVKFHDGEKLTAADVAKSLEMIAFPPEGVLSPRSSDFEMVDK